MLGLLDVTDNFGLPGEVRVMGERGHMYGFGISFFVTFIPIVANS